MCESVSDLLILRSTFAFL